MSPVPDFPDARFDAFRRTDRYGPLGRTRQPVLEYLRLLLSAVTLVPLKSILVLTVIVAHYCVCRLRWLLPAGVRDRVLVAAGAVAARGALTGLGFTSVSHVALAYAPGTGPAPDGGGKMVNGMAVANGGGGGGVNARPHPPVSSTPPLPGAIVSNHVGYCDVLVHMARGVSSFVARGATKDVPLVGVIR